MNTNVLRAVFSRNFVSYFANPTGYVFICVFVLLSAFAAFWPNEFFNANLANLGQLNQVFPFIMLIFVPAITMGIWAEERHQGTDELILTIPAHDFDIVLGKYLAAVAIYTVSLLFSMLSNYLVFILFLGHPDPGLFIGTYVGYWFVGLAMLAIGMAASFLTGNLTVAYVLGALFNAPLVFAAAADAIFGPQWALAVKEWSISQQFRDFGRGVISSSGIAYFAVIVVVLLYVAMVLIGRRHWLRGKSAAGMAGHFLIRALSLAVMAVCVNVFFQYHDARVDVTQEQMSSLSSETIELVRGLDPERPIQIEAFISPEVPEDFVQTRLNLISTLRELQALGGDKVRVRFNRTEQYSEEASLAEDRYGITARRVEMLSRGAFSTEQIFMGVAFTCGLEKVILPFIGRGIPVEYELVRSIVTVAKGRPRTIGIVDTDAKLYGQFNMQAMSPGRDWPIIAELEKQYNVVRVDPSQPISDEYDALLAVQPSSLGPEQLDNLVTAIQNGMPTAIFEDPMPIFAPQVPGTDQPRRAPGGMMGMRQPPPPKGDVAKLWSLLGVDFLSDRIIWQEYNPYKSAEDVFPKEFVFTDDGSGQEEPFNVKDPISAGLQHLLFPFPGSVLKDPATHLEFAGLVFTGDETGTVAFEDMLQMSPFGPQGLNPARRHVPTGFEYVMAAHITGKAPAKEEPTSDETKDDGGKDDKEKADAKKPAKINVVVVADIDMLSEQFFRLREQGQIPAAGIDFKFDNVTFVLNILDSLAGDDRFIAIRSRRPEHRTLTQIEKATEEARKKTAEKREELNKKFDEAKEEEQQALDKKIENLRKRKNVDPQQLLIEVAMAQQEGQRRLETKVDQLTKEKDKEIDKIETDLAIQTRRVQNSAKMWAVFAPPVLPLGLALFVFFYRRAKEREGVSEERLRG